MEKKGQYLIIDAFIAFSILSIGVLFVLGHSRVDPPTESLEIVAEEAAASILEVKVKDLNDPVIKDQIRRGYITNTENSLLQQAYELQFHSRSSLESSYFINASIRKLFPSQFNGEVRVNDRAIYSKGDPEDHAENVVSIKKVVFGSYQDEEFWGPLRAEVRLWD